MKKKKLGVWSPLTFFYIKLRSFEVLKIGKKTIFQHPEAYSEPCQTLKMEPFAKIVNSFLALNL